MKKNCTKIAAAALLGLTFALNGLPFDIVPGTAAGVQTVMAADYTYNTENGVNILTVYNADIVPTFEQKSEVKQIVFAEGSVLPADCTNFFSGYSACTFIDLSKADSSNVTNMMYMFNACTQLTLLNLTNFDTSNVTNMSFMFNACSGISVIYLASFDTNKVTNMSGMFYGCSKATTIYLPASFVTSEVTNMSAMFSGCHVLTTLDVSKFNTSKVTKIQNMFYDCAALTSLDLSGFDLTQVTKDKYKAEMFTNCTSLKDLTLGANFGDIITDMKLPNGAKGWAKGSGTTSVSGTGTYAAFTNDGLNTYHNLSFVAQPGDVDGDLDIDKVDAALLLRYVSHVNNNLTAEQIARGDIVGNNGVDLLDVIKILG